MLINRVNPFSFSTPKIIVSPCLTLRSRLEDLEENDKPVTLGKIIRTEMKTITTYMAVVLYLLCSTKFSFAEGGDDTKIRHAVSGHIRDAGTGEDLIGATVYIKELNQ